MNQDQPDTVLIPILVGGKRVHIKSLNSDDWLEVLKALPEEFFVFISEHSNVEKLMHGDISNEAREYAKKNFTWGTIFEIERIVKATLPKCAVGEYNLDQLNFIEVMATISDICYLNNFDNKLARFFRDGLPPKPSNKGVN